MSVRARAKRALGRVARRVVPPREGPPPSMWDLRRDDRGELALDGVALRGLLERHGSPLHVVNVARLRANAARFRHGGACEPFVSYKTNPVPGVLRVLHDEGLGAEVTSPYELWLALELGVDPGSIVYGGPAKSPSSLALAVERGVGLLNVNDASELPAIAAVARAQGKRQRVGVRVVPAGRLAGQFGVRIDDGAAFAAFRAALALPELQVVAMHAHPNGSIRTLAQLDAYLSPLLAFADELHARLGLSLEILDVGGNLASRTIAPIAPRAARLALSLGVDAPPASPNAVCSIDDYVARVVERVHDPFRAAHRAAPRIFLEPGRALMGDAQMLLCRVLAVRPADDGGIRYAVLDAGLNVADPLRGEAHAIFPLAENAGRAKHVHRLMGPTCTFGDRVDAARTLPDLEPGDALAVMDAGAYFVASSTDFSFPRPAIVAVEEGVDRVLRRAESFRDMIALDAVEARP